MIVHCAHADDLLALGERLAAGLFPGAVLLLHGDLGAGKTTLAQGIARGLGVQESVTSPTYAIVNEYPLGRLSLFHADVYRLNAVDELVSAGIAERVGEGGVWVVEWPSRFPMAWPAGRVDVRLRPEGEGRSVELTATDAAHARILSFA